MYRIFSLILLNLLFLIHSSAHKKKRSILLALVLDQAITYSKHFHRKMQNITRALPIFFLKVYSSAAFTYSLFHLRISTYILHRDNYRNLFTGYLYHIMKPTFTDCDISVWKSSNSNKKARGLKLLRSSCSE